MAKLFVLLFLLLPLVWSCSNRNSRNALDEETYTHYLETGSELSAKAQSALLSHVSGAMKQGGSVYAVEFCNLKAADITDSLNTNCNCIISRVSDKNRNPENALETETEKQVWDYFLAVHDSRMIHDTVVVEGEQAVYYKPIITGMAACLQCHGPVEQIDSATYQKIRELYPNDKATGYAMNELRGLWKIRFPLSEQ